MQLADLQTAIRNPDAIVSLQSYFEFTQGYLAYLDAQLATAAYTTIKSSTVPYIFFRAKSGLVDGLTRPVNSELFVSREADFAALREQFESTLDVIRTHRGESKLEIGRRSLDPMVIDRLAYTVQLSIGCTADTFESPNQSRKRVGQLFENLIRNLINVLGVECGEGTVGIPTGFPGAPLKYQMDLIFPYKQPARAGLYTLSSGQAVGSVKTDSKDRLEQLFVEKFLMTRLLGRTVPFTAIFLHDVQRAVKNGIPTGINSTFLSNKFVAYKKVLTELDGVYYLDPRPSMLDPEIGIQRFSNFLIHGLWKLVG